ncbi:MAG TPA: UDP-N-acetylmuramate dehydrogenase [bacterium]|nr:UDP-N-acetylmuramate dehydrogenase [bacterium]
MVEIFENYSLKDYNTFQVEARANYFARCQSINELKELLASSEFQQNSHFVLGGGSNLLFTTDFEGIIVYPDLRGLQILDQTDSNIIIKVSNGEVWDNFVGYCVRNNYGGIENLSWIPGKLGAVPVQNIGAYGAEAGDRIVEVEALEISTGKLKTFSNKECKFGYRDSIFKNQEKENYIIVAVTFELIKDPPLITDYGGIEAKLKNYDQENIQVMREIIIDIRKNKLPDPDQIGNAGSFFKNPIVDQKKFESIKEEYSKMPFYKLSSDRIKIPAGWIIEKCGWKGRTIGDAGVYEKQALIIVNNGQATGQEIYELSQKIEADVKAKFGIELEREVQVL